jgi:predicted transcriptional regulator
MARKTLKTEQYTAIEYLSKPQSGGKTYAEIASICGVTERTLYNWLNDDDFDAELRKASKKNASKYVPDVIKAMAEFAVKDGNAAAGKLILQMAEQLTEKHEINTIKTDVPQIDELKRMVAEIDTEE